MAIVEGALARLTTFEKRVVELIYTHRVTQREAASRLGVAPQQVNQAVRNALRVVAAAVTRETGA